MKKGYVGGMIAGGLLGISAGAIIISQMTPGGRRMMRRGRRMLRSYMHGMGIM